MKKILILSHDVIGAAMAGPGIRYFYLAQALSDEFDVTLALPARSEKRQQPAELLETGNLRLTEYQERDWASIAPLIQQADACLLNGYIVFLYPELNQVQTPLIIDGYDPLLAEWLAATHDRPQEQLDWWGEKISQLTPQYLVGDFFICASERQRDWWLGLLENAGRINPWTIRTDPSLRKLVDVVPFGIRSDRPQHTRAVMRGVWPGIGEYDKILLWGGGLWLWLDPLTAVRAVARVWGKRQDVRLVFPGTRRPIASGVHPPTHLEAVRQEASQLGLLDKAVFLGEWVDYSDWPNVLLESDLALSLHPQELLEGRLAFRTRILDCVWAGLPVVATSGDSTAEMVREYKLGILANAQDVEGVAASILELLNTPRQALEPGFETARRNLTWEQAARPLAAFCRNPDRAPDRGKHARDENSKGAHSMGNPYYLAQIEQQQAQIALLQSQAATAQTEILTLQEQVLAYRQRRVVRLLDRLAQVAHRWSAGSKANH